VKVFAPIYCDSVPSFRPSSGYFSGKLRKNALDIIKVPMKIEYSKIDYVPLLTILLMGCPAFLRKQSSLVVESILLRTLLVLGFKQTSCENIHLKKLKGRHAAIQVIKKIFDKNLSLPLVVHSWAQLDGGSPNKQKSFGGCGCNPTDRAERDLKFMSKPLQACLI